MILMRQKNTATKRIALLMAVLCTVAVTMSGQVVRKDSLTRQRNAEMLDEKVIVGSDTVSIIIPEHNFGRYDRGLYNYLFIPKGQWSFGLSASYGELNTDDVQVLNMLKDVDFKGKIYSIQPTIGYFIRNNQSVGIKLTYSRGTADLANLAVDFDDDINFKLKDVSYYTESYVIGGFYGNYVGLGRDKRFGVFNVVPISSPSK